MDASQWYWVLGVVGGMASIIAILILAMPPSSHRKAGIGATILLAFVGIALVVTRSPESISDVKVSIETGTYSVADFMEFLSHGPFKVTMDPTTAEDLRRRHVKISTQNLKDASLQYVLERVVTPQLPGPQQWTYEIVGKTIVIQRR